MRSVRSHNISSPHIIQQLFSSWLLDLFFSLHLIPTLMYKSAYTILDDKLFHIFFSSIKTYHHQHSSWKCFFPFLFILHLVLDVIKIAYRRIVSKNRFLLSYILSRKLLFVTQFYPPNLTISMKLMPFRWWWSVIDENKIKKGGWNETSKMYT